MADVEFAQAVIGSTVNVDSIIYNVVAAPGPPPDELAKAEARFAALPAGTVPDVAPLPPRSVGVPARNVQFVGRQTDLVALASTIRTGGTAAVATGIGGVGKTQLAVEFAHRYGQFFAGGVFWLSFADAGAIAGEVALCGGIGGLELRPDHANLPLTEQVRAVAAAWLSPMPRLLIFDNCEDERLLRQWRPPSGGCQVLLTSRIGKWSTDLGVTARAIEVLDRGESIALLRRYRPDIPADEPALDGIADELGDLPLALHLAGSFMETYRGAAIAEPKGYLERIARPDLLQHASLIGKHDGHSPTDHDRNVARTFKLSFDRLDRASEADPLALALLARLACFAPGESVPNQLLLSTLDPAPATIVDEATQLLRLDALNRLVRLGLATQPTPANLKLHRLIARFTAAEVDLGPGQEAVEQTMFATAARINAAGLPAPLVPLELHLRHIAEQADAGKSPAARHLLNELGYHLLQLGRLYDARPVYERALGVAEAAYGSDHPDLAVHVNNLGRVLNDLGELSGARAAFERALRIDEAAHGPDHPNVAIRISNLGSVLGELGDLQAARASHERALRIDEATYGPDHPSVATRINNLGGVLKDLGDLAGARAAYERALRIDEAAYGPDHPSVAIRINNLGGVLKDLGDLPGARAAHERALRIFEAAYGPDHPQVGVNLNNLGFVLRDLGDLEGARAAYERALRIVDATRGPCHPRVAITQSNLGNVLKKLRDLPGASAALERALRIDESAYGPHHPNVAIRLNNLGSVLKDIGDLTGARAALVRSRDIFETTYGPEHPSTRTVQANLDFLEGAIGNAGRPQ